MKFHDELKAHSPFFMRELAKELVPNNDKDEIDKVYKKIYMQVRIYHRLEWDCQEEKRGTAGRSPLKCVYVGVKK